MTNEHQLSEFAIGERVFVKPSPRNRSKPWIHGEVVNKSAPRSCTVRTPLGLVHQNHAQIDHFTVVCSVTWPLDGREAGVDLVLIQTSLLLLCKTSCSDAN